MSGPTADVEATVLMLELTDGTHQAFLPRAIVRDGELEAVEVEIIEVFSGDEAVAAAIQDGVATSAEDLDSPAYLRRPGITGIVAVAPDLSIEVLDPPAGPLRRTTVDEFIELYDGPPPGPGDALSPGPVELTVLEGVVVHIAQFYLA